MTLRKSAYGLLLTAMVLLLCMMSGIGSTQARFVTATSWNTVLLAETGQEITANTQPILSKKVRTLEFAVSDTLQEANTQYTIERLTAEGSYEPFEHASLTVTYTNGTVTVTLVDETPLPGTYRLVAAWTTAATEQTEETEQTEGTEQTAETEPTEVTEQTATATFFINYSDG